MPKQKQTESKEQLPELVEKTIRLLRKADDNSFFLNTAATKQIESALASYVDKPELANVAMEMAQLAILMREEKNSPQVCDVLLALLHKLIPQLEKIGAAASAAMLKDVLSVSDTKEKTAQKLTGNTARATDPRVKPTASSNLMNMLLAKKKSE